MNIEEFILFAQPEPWMDRANCTHLEPSAASEIFFPEKGRLTDRAAKFCNACPVKTECTEYANRTRSEYGTWGGEYRSPRALAS